MLVVLHSMQVCRHSPNLQTAVIAFVTHSLAHKLVLNRPIQPCDACLLAFCFAVTFVCKQICAGVQVMRKNDLIRKNMVESVKNERNILAMANNPFVVSIA